MAIGGCIVGYGGNDRGQCTFSMAETTDDGNERLGFPHVRLTCIAYVSGI